MSVGRDDKILSYIHMAKEVKYCIGGWCHSLPHHTRPSHRKGGLVTIIDRILGVSPCSLQSIRYLLQWAAAITESDSKRQKTERQMLLTSDGSPYLVSGIPGRWFTLFREDTIFFFSPQGELIW